MSNVALPIAEENGEPFLRFSLRDVLVLVTVVAAAIALIAPAVSAAREAARRMTASNNAKQVSLAVQNYHDIYSVFPTAIIHNTDGKAMRGWRFTIVPYLESSDLYRRFDQNRLWNDPKNLAVTQFTHHSYDRPGQRNTVPYATNFVGITGPATLFPDGGWCKCSYIEDGPENTILVAEFGPSDIPWYEPRDLRIDTISFRINDPDRRKPSVGSRLTQGAIVAFADGHVAVLPEDTPPETLRAMFTIAGND